MVHYKRYNQTLFEMKKGRFVISLDFELFWGIHDAFEINDYYKNVYNVKFVIPRLLSLFEQYHTRATFATVGTIYHSTYDEFINFSSDIIKPCYSKQGLSPYEDENKVKERQYPELHFAPELINKIRESGQEIGTHTYSHYYCTESGADIPSFTADIKKAVEIARQNGDDVRSIIFPRNQVGSASFLKILREQGLTSYRGNPYEDFTGRSALKRAHRFIESYFSVTDETANVIAEDGIVNIPASHFLRPYSKYNILNILQSRRIKKSMKRAAKYGKVYHLWWHPHNMGGDINGNMVFLENILKYYCELNKKYGMESVSMSDLASTIKL